ncbi:MAG: hypothetical protein LBD74_03890 [Spirochaetaceae bacterium]|jgi:hypothetical protein|nr:hypothetical protein [Spirochaetaceae bacterium]
MDMVLAGGGRTYEVNAFINGYSLNECSIINRNDTIQPYFVDSVGNDPDLRGLVIFLQDPSGQTVGKKIRYTLASSKSVEKLLEPQPILQDPSPATPAPVETAEPEPEPEPEPEAEAEAAAAETTLSEEAAETEEEFSLPMDAGELEPPEKSENRNYVFTPDETDVILSVARLDKELPAYTIRESLEIGQYTLVFQVLGEKNVLAAIERPVYFLGDAVLQFDEIQRYLPGFSKTAHFVPPTAPVLLEAQALTDARLDPYVIWYSGKQRIAEGKLSEDTRYLFWQAPERTGFYTIKAVLFPFKPPANTALSGRVKELSLPVSAKHEIPGYFADRSDEFIHWYQLQNKLLDTKNPQDLKKSLRPTTQERIHWAPHGGIYGLSVGPQDIYRLPELPVLLADDEQGVGDLVFRALFRAPGTVAQAVFTGDDPAVEAVKLALSFTGETVILHVASSSRSQEEALHLPSPVLQDFLALRLAFTIQKHQFTAQVALADRDAQSKPCAIPLAAPLNGDGRWQFGAELPLPETLQESEGTVEGVIILDEVGLSFTKTPLPLISSQTEETLPEMF